MSPPDPTLPLTRFAGQVGTDAPAKTGRRRASPPATSRLPVVFRAGPRVRSRTGDPAYGFAASEIEGARIHDVHERIRTRAMPAPATWLGLHLHRRSGTLRSPSWRFSVRLKAGSVSDALVGRGRQMAHPWAANRCEPSFAPFRDHASFESKASEPQACQPRFAWPLQRKRDAARLLPRPKGCRDRCSPRRIELDAGTPWADCDRGDRRGRPYHRRPDQGCDARRAATRWGTSARIAWHRPRTARAGSSS
jgi:hypothetical protein